MVNPFNGEGIAYAMEAGEMAARVIVQALARPTGVARRACSQGYPQALKDAYGGYYTLGRTFVEADRQPEVHEVRDQARDAAPGADADRHEAAGQPDRARGGDAADRVINALSRMTPAAYGDPRPRAEVRRGREARDAEPLRADPGTWRPGRLLRDLLACHGLAGGPEAVEPGQA